MFHQFDFFISQDVASCDCATDCRSFHLAVCIILRACESLSPDVFHHSVRMSEWVGLQVFPPQLVNEWRSGSVQLWMCVQSIEPSCRYEIKLQCDRMNIHSVRIPVSGWACVPPLCAFTLNDILIPLLIYSLAHKLRCFGHECVCLVLCKAMRSCHHETLDFWRKIAISSFNSVRRIGGEWLRTSHCTFKL